MSTAVFMVLLLLVIYQAANFAKVIADSPTKIIESFRVRSDIRYRLATTQVESVIRNVAGMAQEIVFDVTLPKEAFIVDFFMDIDGKVYKGEVKEKTEAKKQYQQAVDKGESAGHVRQAPRHSNIFEVSANVESGSAANFTLTYQEMLRRKLGVYKHEIHVNPGQAVNDFLIEVFIQESKPLRMVKTPALRKGSLISNKIEAENRLTTVDRPSAETAHITYRPSVADQTNTSTPAIFMVEYDVEHTLQGEVLVVDGYFVHFFSPDLPPMPKDIVFVLDVSGSMYGQKMEQMKSAMLTILNDLQPDDRFNIITFSSDVNSWADKFITATKEKIDEAKDFIKLITAEGGTNINDALLAGISGLRAREDKQRVSMIFFLTDGQATSGITNSKEIAANVLQSNENISPIFGLAFGTGADYDLLTMISGQNSGFARKIYEDSDAALQVASLYEEIAAVSTKDVTINYLPSSVDEYTLTKRKFPVIFNGSEVIICGRMADNANIFQMEIKGSQKSGSLDLSLNVDNVTNIILTANDNLNTFFTMPRDLSGIIEKMWAYMTIKQYLKEKEMHPSDEEKVGELKKKILQMSLQYKFVTPLTSMVVTKPDSPEKAIESGLEDTDDHVQKSGFLPFSMHAQRASSMYISQGSPAARKSHGGSAMYNSQGGSPMLQNQVPSTWQRKKVQAPNGHLINPSFNIILSNTNTGLQMKSGSTPPFGHHRLPMPQATKTPAQMFATYNGPTDNTPSGFLLAAIKAEVRDLSICFAPNGVKEGNYSLIQSPKGTELDIETTCSDRKCKNLLIKSLILRSNGNSTIFSAGRDGYLIHKPSVYVIAKNTAANTTTISVDDLDLSVSWLEKDGAKHYTLSIKVKSERGYKGLVGKTLNMSVKQLNKWRKAKVPTKCRGMATDISKFLKNKMAARYMVKVQPSV